MQIFWPGVVSIAVMYSLIFGVGLWASRGHTEGGETAENLMLAGRKIPLWLGLLTMCATWVGGGYINGAAQTTYQYGLTWGLQAPIGYSLSLIVGGLWFARIMRKNEYSTLIDPFEIRFGKGIALVLALFAVTSEILWSAAILVALGSTSATVLGIDANTALVLSAFVAIGYTITGGLWSVTYTDAVQLVLIAIGLMIALPYGWDTAGGYAPIAHAAQTDAGLVGFRGAHEVIAYADLALLCLLGGIPWNIYFQRVLASPNEDVAAKLSIGGGVLCLLMAVPPILLGLAARATDWAALGANPVGMGLDGSLDVVGTLAAHPEMVLPLQLRLAVPSWVGVVGLGAVAAAVMSSTDASILSATSMASRNAYRRLLRPHASASEMVWLMRVLIVVIGLGATAIGLAVPSVTALWYLCSDVVYVTLFPALILALFDKRVNRTGIAVGLLLGSILRVGGGEPALGIPAFIPYPVWTDAGMGAFPFRTIAMLTVLVVAFVLSRATAAFDPPVPLRAAGDPATMG